MRVLVSGATGFLGGHLLPALVAAGHEAVGLCRTAPAEPGGVTWVTADLTGPLPELPPVDAVVHLAQSRRYREFPAAADDVFAVNVGGTFRLLELARARGARFVFASTGSVYAPSDAPLTEEAPTSAAGFYAASKLAAEALIEPYGAELPAAVTLRLFFPYGAGQPAGTLFPSLARRVARGAAIDLHGADGLVLNPIHASDVVAALLGALALSGHHLLNLAGPEVVSLRDVGRALGAALGREPVFAEHPPRPPGRLVADIARLSAALGAPAARFAERAAELDPGQG